MREIILALVLLAVAITQTTLLPRPLGVTPNILLLLITLQALIAGPTSASRWAFYGGLALDICSGSLLGLHALALLVAVVFAWLPLRRLSRENWFLPLLGTLFAALGYYGTKGVLTAILIGQFSAREYIVVAMLPDTLLVLIPTLPLFMIWRTWLSRRHGEVAVDLY